VERPFLSHALFGLLQGTNSFPDLDFFPSPNLFKMTGEIKTRLIWALPPTIFKVPRQRFGDIAIGLEK
jgi:hypothetical protein